MNTDTAENYFTPEEKQKIADKAERRNRAERRQYKTGRNLMAFNKGHPTGWAKRTITRQQHKGG